ncbi:unnamed protein product, partial [Gulo gulo]
MQPTLSRDLQPHGINHLAILGHDCDLAEIPDRRCGNGFFSISPPSPSQQIHSFRISKMYINFQAFNNGNLS